jgi:hypothetical protein
MMLLSIATVQGVRLKTRSLTKDGRLSGGTNGGGGIENCMSNPSPRN